MGSPIAGEQHRSPNQDGLLRDWISQRERADKDMRSGLQGFETQPWKNLPRGQERDLDRLLREPLGHAGCNGQRCEEDSPGVVNDYRARGDPAPSGSADHAGPRPGGLQFLHRPEALEKMGGGLKSVNRAKLQSVPALIAKAEAILKAAGHAGRSRSGSWFLEFVAFQSVGLVSLVLALSLSASVT